MSTDKYSNKNENLARAIMTAALSEALGITYTQAKTRYTKNMPVGEFWLDVAEEVGERQEGLVRLSEALGQAIVDACATQEERDRLKQATQSAGA